jgi:phosphoglycerol transferase MdoB-like AlkP superfamily enzyme
VKSLPNLPFDLLLVLKIYGVGLFFDCVTFSYAAIPFVLTTMLLPDKVFNSRFFKPTAWLLFFVITYLLLFNVIAEYTFFDEFATRFNFIAVDYLIYTNEVVRNIVESYPVYWILGGLLVANCCIFFMAIRKPLERCFGMSTRLGQRFRTGLVLLALPLLSYLLVDISMTGISPNNYAEELAGNGLYNLVAAFRNNELDYRRFYVTRDDKEVMGRFRELVTDRTTPFVSRDSNEIARLVQHQGGERHHNVIVIIEESLSADYLGVFGNKDKLTPNLDRLANESLFFTHLYATGTRTVRGLEALTLGIPPLPGSSIVRRPDNGNFFSWGSVMKSKGYDNKFIYAGNGYFDNMNAFYANNGFTTVDRKNFASDEVTFANAWGVCDGDLFNKVIKEADKSYQQQKPFFSMVMTTSNHRPFTYPDGKIDIPSHSGRSGGVKYCDYALGQLLADARKKPWFNNTIFVIVADHCSSSAGKVALPVKHYEIPLFIYAPALLKPRKIDRMMSQIDVPPTLLGLLNFSYASKFIGRDVFSSDPGEERAFIATYQKLGYIRGDRLLVLGPKKAADYYSFNRKDGKTTGIKPDQGLLLDALGYYQGAYHIYKNRLNRLTN